MTNAQMQEILESFSTLHADMAARSASVGKPITCSRGCCACCSEPVYVTPEEARLIAEAIPASELAGVKERLRAWKEKLEPSGLLNLPADRIPTEKEMVEVLPYRLQNAPCPLLKDSECLVYSSRPIGCRSHAAVGPKRFCDENDLRPRQIFVVAKYLHAVIARKVMESGGEIHIGHLGVELGKILSPD